jgi:AcrR family transcriptional regulator
MRRAVEEAHRMRDYDGKTAAERIAERRARLIRAGLELFGEHGYAGTSIRAVLRESGLRDRYFGESFADLDSLLAAVYDELIDEQIAACRTAIAAAAGPSAAARAMIATISGMLESSPGAARIKLREALAAGPVSRSHRQQGLHRLAQLVADLLPVTSTHTDEDRLLLGVGLVAAADAHLLGWLNGDAGLTSDRVVDLVAFMFDSVAANLTLTPTG